MEWHDVTTQADLSAAVAAGHGVNVHAGVFTAYGSAQVRAYGSAQVRASGSAQVRAYGSAQVRASDSAQVTAYGSAQVTASDSAQVTAYGSAQVTASWEGVAITVHGDGPRVEGGTVIRCDAPHDVREWCRRYGVTVTNGVVVLFKAVNDRFTTQYGVDYSPGSCPVSPDWDGGVQECGGGLHFSPVPWMALKFFCEATRFVACPIRIDDIRVPRPKDTYPEKVKAGACCGAVWECDRDGNRIERGHDEVDVDNPR